MAAAASSLRLPLPVGPGVPYATTVTVTVTVTHTGVTAGDCHWHPQTMCMWFSCFWRTNILAWTDRSCCLFVREQKDESLLRLRLARGGEPFEKEEASAQQGMYTSVFNEVS